MIWDYGMIGRTLADANRAISEIGLDPDKVIALSPKSSWAGIRVRSFMYAYEYEPDETMLAQINLVRTGEGQ